MANKKDFINGLRAMDLEDLENKIVEDEFRLKKLKFAHAVSPLENPATIRALRRDLARAKTELRNRKSENTVENN